MCRILQLYNIVKKLSICTEEHGSIIMKKGGLTAIPRNRVEKKHGNILRTLNGDGSVFAHTLKGTAKYDTQISIVLAKLQNPLIDLAIYFSFIYILSL